MSLYRFASCLASAIVAVLISATDSVAAEPTPSRPNVISMLADDMGYGELQCLNPQRGKIPTPRLFLCGGFSRELFQQKDHRAIVGAGRLVQADLAGAVA